MELKDVIALAVGGVILIGIIIYLVCTQKQKIIEWLKWAVVEAEKLLGTGTGQLKLRQVYDWFCEQFSFLSAIIPFQVFSAWVDVALETMDKWLSENKQITAYVKNEVQ
jgi:hypothetical protein